MGESKRRPGNGAALTDMDGAKRTTPADRIEFPCYRLDPKRMLRPGCITHVFEVDDCPIEDSLMVEIPEAIFLKTYGDVRRLVADELQRTLVVIMVRDEPEDAA